MIDTMDMQIVSNKSLADGCHYMLVSFLYVVF